jgi:hypothetical protein
VSEADYSSGEDYVVEFLGYRFHFNEIDFEERVTAAAVRLGLLPHNELDGDERADLVELAADGRIVEPRSGLGRYLVRNWEYVALMNGESLVYWLRKLVFRGAWLDQRVKSGLLDVTWDETAADFGYRDPRGDRALLELVLPKIVDIVEHHVRGTHYGIVVDPKDGLLRQGAEGYQLTWMDAKVEGWVVTPRRGKAVEINALWYNALCLLEGWVRERVGSAEGDALAGHAARARRSFNERFWYAGGGYLYDVVDGPEGDSTECRPNQVFAISLKHPVLDESRWEAVLETVEQRLLTPVGLRSLAPGSPNYRPTYDGDLRSRDAAYHQGTVWGWLIGPWVDAWLRVHPADVPQARRFVDGLVTELDTFGLGSIAEIFDAEAPYTPRGCIAQAWSVAEALRCLARTA